MKIRLSDRQSYATGWHPGVLVRTLRGMPGFVKDVLQYRKMGSKSRFPIRLRNLFPILSDRAASAGFAGGHYFYQDLWAARRIYEANPTEHVDIGSRVDGFIAHLLSFRTVKVVDIRPLTSEIPGLIFVQDDATELAQFGDESVSSLSSLHVAEHFGLGRYGDPIDPDACFKFMAALQRVLAVGGRLYFSVPIGRERVEFNAHRVFAPTTILNSFATLKLVSFAMVGDDGSYCEHADPYAIGESELACGLFEFTKLQPASLPGSQMG